MLGKTVLCACLIQNFAMSSSDPLAYFFFSAAETPNDHLSCIRTLLAQLVAKHQDAFELAMERAPDKDTNVASTSKIWDVLAALARATPRCTFVIDGLDESGQAGDKRKQFLAELKQAVAHTATRILVVSRDEVDIRAELAPDAGSHSTASPPELTLSELRITKDDVRDDVACFTQSVVDRRLPKKPEAVRHDLATQMAGKCEGMFLWVNLQKDELSRDLC